MQGDLTMLYQKILVPLDSSPLSEAALPHARALAHLMQATIVLVCVTDFPHYDYTVLDASHTERMNTEADRTRQTMQDYLDHTASTLKAEGFNVSTELRGDRHVANTILAVADDVRADVIVMSTHGRSGITRWLIGSVADKIVHGAKVPVLLIRPPL